MSHEEHENVCNIVAQSSASFQTFARIQWVQTVVSQIPVSKCHLLRFLEPFITRASSYWYFLLKLAPSSNIVAGLVFLCVLRAHRVHIIYEMKWKRRSVEYYHPVCCSHFDITKLFHDHQFKSIRFQINRVRTLLISRSFSSKWRPYSFGVSPGIGSILMQTSIPFLAIWTSLWLTCSDEIIPRSSNCKMGKK